MSGRKYALPGCELPTGSGAPATGGWRIRWADSARDGAARRSRIADRATARLLPDQLDPGRIFRRCAEGTGKMGHRALGTAWAGSAGEQLRTQQKYLGGCCL